MVSDEGRSIADLSKGGLRTMKRWMWAAPVAAAALSLSVVGITARPKPLEAAPKREIIAIDFSKMLRGRAFTGTTEESKCTIENTVGPDTVRTTDVQSGIKVSTDVVPSGCDETPSTGGLDGKFEAELAGFEKRSASGGDVPPRPAVDQPEKDNRGVFRGKWRIRNNAGAVVAEGEITVFLHVNTHYPPAIVAGVPECFVEGQLEGFLEGTATLGEYKGCRLYASLAGRSFAETPAGVDIILNAEGLVLCPCDDKHKKLKIKTKD
jgi:hypothetical protein